MHPETWSIDLPRDREKLALALHHGLVLAVDIDPRVPVVVFAARQPGLGDAMVGQHVIYRQWLGASGTEPITADELDAVLSAAHRWLDTPQAAVHLHTIAAGYRCERLWSGDELADWTEDARQAAQIVIRNIIAAMEDDSAP